MTVKNVGPENGFSNLPYLFLYVQYVDVVVWGSGACVSTTELILVKLAQNPEYGKTKVYLERF